jgi:hypothetical protein
MLSEINEFVNWTRRRNAQARTWRDYGYDLHSFVEVVGDRPPGEITFRDLDRDVSLQAERGSNQPQTTAAWQPSSAVCLPLR